MKRRKRKENKRESKNVWGGKSKRKMRRIEPKRKKEKNETGKKNEAGQIDIWIKLLSALREMDQLFLRLETGKPKLPIKVTSI